MATEDGATRLDAKDLERILKVTRALARPSDTTTMLASVIDAGRSVLGAERGTVFLYDAENEELVAGRIRLDMEIRGNGDTKA